MAGEGIGDVVQLLVWEVNEIERVEVEKEPKDWAVGDEVSHSTCHSTSLSVISISIRIITSTLHSFALPLVI